MKHSIRTKITFSFICLMMLTILGCWIINTLFLRTYYIHYKVENMQYIYDQINSMWSAEIFWTTDQERDIPGWNNIKAKLQSMSDEYGAGYLIMDSTWNGYFTSYSEQNTVMMRNRLQENLFMPYANGEILYKSDKSNGRNEMYIKRILYPDMNSEYLECWGFLDCGTPCMITVPMEGIHESAAISNRFFLYIAVITLLIGSVMIYVLSSNISKPVRELTAISEKMRNLDFQTKYHGKTKDEVETLGNNMNSLSETLDKTITDLKNANLELTKDIEKKEKIDQMRMEFISNVSHELKTPIALIQGYAEGLKEGISDDPESFQFYCDVIIDEANKMNNMVRKFLTLNQMESGNEPVELTHFMINDLLEGVINNASIIIEQKGITIQNEVEPKLYVYADEFLIEEVLTNYLSNAINHCENEMQIRIRSERMDSTVRFIVENTGKCIPEEDLGKVWIKFFKVDKARTREYGGSGIGLSIVKAIMEAHNQKYGCENIKDGVRFWFELEI